MGLNFVPKKCRPTTLTTTNAILTGQVWTLFIYVLFPLLIYVTVYMQCGH